MVRLFKEHSYQDAYVEGLDQLLDQPEIDEDQLRDL